MTSLQLTLVPSLNGFELYSEIRSIDYKIKVFFLTALTDLHDYDDFKSNVSPRLHRRHFVQKPVEKEQFLDQVYFILFWTRLIFYVIDKRLYHSNDYIFFMILLDTLYFLVLVLSGFVKGFIGGKVGLFLGNSENPNHKCIESSLVLPYLGILE